MGCNAFSRILTLFQYMDLSIIYDLEKLILWLCVKYQNWSTTTNMHREIIVLLSWLLLTGNSWASGLGTG